MTRLVHFCIFKRPDDFHHIGIVSDRYSGSFPHWHRKGGILPLHWLLAELAS
jgi:hypothetical protein